MRFFAILPVIFAVATQAAPTARALPVIEQVDDALDALGLSLDNTIEELVTVIGLKKTDDELTSILKAAVHEVDSADNEVDDIVDNLLTYLGEGDLVQLTDALETDLGLQTYDTIGHLLTELHLI